MGNCACIHGNGGDNQQVDFSNSNLNNGTAMITVLKTAGKAPKLDDNLFKIINERLSKSNISTEVISKEEFNHLLHSYSKMKEIIKEYEEKLQDLSTEIRDESNIEMPPLKFTNQNGNELVEYYQGEYNIKGEFSGIGIYISNKNEIYYGEFKEDEYNGKGLFVTENGNSIFGDWQNGKCSGKSTLVIQGEYQYNGDFSNNYKHGQGEEQYRDGTKFQGNFKNGLKSGYGKFLFPNGESYEGNFENDLFNGEGTYIWPKEGRKYVGQFKNNTMEGYGINTYEDGSIYNGHYFSGVKQGKGVYTWPDGKKFYGNWINNEVHGNGYYIVGDEKYEITFRFGKIISSKVQNTNNGNNILKIENVEEINSIKDIYKYICPVCNRILNNPQKCLRCSLNYCFDCVNSRTKLVCRKCKGNEYETNLGLIPDLNSKIKFKCDKCNEVFTYKEAIEHYHPQ